MHRVSATLPWGLAAAVVAVTHMLVIFLAFFFYSVMTPFVGSPETISVVFVFVSIAAYVSTYTVTILAIRRRKQKRNMRFVLMISHLFTIPLLAGFYTFALILLSLGSSVINGFGNLSASFADWQGFTGDSILFAFLLLSPILLLLAVGVVGLRFSLRLGGKE